MCKSKWRRGEVRKISQAVHLARDKFRIVRAAHRTLSKPEGRGVSRVHQVTRVENWGLKHVIK